MKKNYGQVVVDENGNYASHFHCLIKNVKNIDKLLLELKDENNINYVDKKTDKFILLLNFMIDLDSHILHIVIIILMDFAFILLIILMLIMIFIDEQKNAYLSQKLDKCRKEGFYATEEEKKSLIRKEYKNKNNRITKKVVTFKERTINQVVEIYEIKKVKKDEVFFVIQFKKYSYIKYVLRYVAA